MRISGGYSLHQSLTFETAAIVKQAVSLARRRGHAQVTPLHVAIAMLSCPTSGLLKRACLQSHSHPLQCKALELCFNVALNRLPTSASSSPLLAPHSHLPSLSNALVAAFKRSQAHQRRGSIENQQQPVLALKVETQQLVISILDDPSVSRVMREAGFSSAQVKNNVEQYLSLEKCNVSNSNNTVSQTIPTITSLSQFKFPSLGKKVNQLAHNDDVILSVLEVMTNKKTKNTIIVGECGESVVRGVIEKFDKKDVPDDMKFVRFISVPLMRNITRDEFEVKLGEIRSYVKNRGAVLLYLGDVDWVSDFWCKYGDEQRDYYYYDCVEYMMIMELSRLIVENKRVWLMGIATLKTYAKCKIGSPSLETLWSLHPLTIPVANLALGLSLIHSDMHDQVEAVDDCKWLLFHQKGGAEIKKQLSCCSDCSENFKKEAHHQAHVVNTSASTSRLPSWLQQYKDENAKQINVDHQEYCDDKIKHLCKKWNSICSSIHKKKHQVTFDVSTSSSTSVSSNGLHKPKLHKNLLNWPSEDRRQICQYDNEFQVSKPNLSAFLPAEEKPDLVSNPNSSPNSVSSSEDNYCTEELPQYNKFKELNSDNLREALEKKVPWQRCIIPEIISTILKCRSGTVRQESWLFFLGADDDHGKETIARELAKAVFGSYDNFIAIGISHFSSTRHHDSTEEVTNIISNKRPRDEHGANLYDRFADAVRHNPSRVFYVEDADRIDYCSSLKGFKKAIKDASVSLSDDGGLALVKDAIVIFSCGKDDEEKNSDELREEKQCGLLDLNIATQVGDDDDDENSVSKEIGILDLVDHKVVFKNPSLINVN